LEIQDVLRHEKGLKSIKKPRWKKSKPEAEVAKTDYLILDTGESGFPITDRV
jgi:hypothetical protein